MSERHKLLGHLGWNAQWESTLSDYQPEQAQVGRVSAVEKNSYRIQFSPALSAWGEIGGKFRHEITSAIECPTVGDWVLTKYEPGQERAIVTRVLPRRTALVRKAAGTAGEEQILAANVDTVLIATSANSDLNPRRLDRYLAIVYESGARPVLLLTKADLNEEVDTLVQDLEVRFPSVEIVAISSATGIGLESLESMVRPKDTVAIIGSSGVGKSTLVNHLINSANLATAEIRESDGRGRHTTTSRQLFVSKRGYLIIDTPGLRELQLADHADGIAESFGEIEQLAAACRFSDCQHRTEPGCAIKEALNSRQLSVERWENYQKLQRETAHEQRKGNKALASAYKKSLKMNK